MASARPPKAQSVHHSKVLEVSSGCWAFRSSYWRGSLHDDRSLATREFVLPAMICSRAGPSDICGCVQALDAFIAPPRCSDRTSWLT